MVPSCAKRQVLSWADYGAMPDRDYGVRPGACRVRRGSLWWEEGRPANIVPEAPRVKVRYAPPTPTGFSTRAQGWCASTYPG